MKFGQWLKENEKKFSKEISSMMKKGYYLPVAYFKDGTDLYIHDGGMTMLVKDNKIVRKDLTVYNSFKEYKANAIVGGKTSAIRDFFLKGK